MQKLKFTIEKTDASCAARVGKVETPHGVFETPAFMAVGTRGSVKGLTPTMLREVGCQIVLGNTYHLMLRPGAETVAALGGLQEMSGWRGPMLTDSGGFQVFSLSDLRDFNEDGVTFKSHIDGSLVRLTPGESMRVQHLLGADIVMAFDDCPPADCGEERLSAAMGRTIAWARTCRDVLDKLDGEGRQALFGIVQGGTNPRERERCATELLKLDFPGYAIGGLAVGEGHERMVETIRVTAPLLPKEKPRYLMGVGYAKDILEAVKLGIDMFDCVLPTRNGRNGLAFTYGGQLRIRNAKFSQDTGPLEAGCDCYCCTKFSRGYLRHLFSVEEMLGPILISLHNVRFFHRWMADIRKAIREDRLTSLVAPVNGAGEETTT